MLEKMTKPHFIDIEGLGNVGIDLSDGNYKITFMANNQNIPIEYFECDGVTGVLYHEGVIVARYFVTNHFRLSEVISHLDYFLKKEAADTVFDQDPLMQLVLEKSKLHHILA